MHCFTGSKEFSEKLMTLNSFFSASGIITFKNSLDLQHTFKSIPMDNILIEKLKYDAQQLNFMKKTSRAKLPL